MRQAHPFFPFFHTYSGAYTGDVGEMEIAHSNRKGKKEIRAGSTFYFLLRATECDGLRTRAHECEALRRANCWGATHLLSTGGAGKKGGATEASPLQAGSSAASWFARPLSGRGGFSRLSSSAYPPTSLLASSPTRRSWRSCGQRGAGVGSGLRKSKRRYFPRATHAEAMTRTGSVNLASKKLASLRHAFAARGR
jgi:hypothetical protein